MAFVGSLISFFLIDLLFSSQPEVVLDLIVLLLLLVFILGGLLYVTEVKNKYLLLTIEKLISAEDEIGISSYFNTYLKDIEKNEFRSIKSAYTTFEDHLRQNYYFRVPSKDYVRVLDSIFKSGDKYCISLASIFSDLRKKLLIEATRNDLTLIISDKISCENINKDFIDTIRKETFNGRVFWRKGDPLHVFDVIISLKEPDNESGCCRPIRALKFEIGEAERIEMMYVITDTESLGFWYRYFNEDFASISEEIKGPISCPIGIDQVKKAIMEICENYPDLHNWMKEVIRGEKSDETIGRALDQLKKSREYKSEYIQELIGIYEEVWLA